MPNRVTIFEKLRHLREISGLSQDHVGRHLGLSQAYISQIETNKRDLTVSTLERLADLYGCTLNYLMDDSQDITEPEIQFAFRGEMDEADLEVLSRIKKIAVNLYELKGLSEK